MIMKFIKEQLKIPGVLENMSDKKGAKKARYGFLWRWVVIVTSFVAITPLVILTFTNYSQYQRAIKEEIKERVHHMTSSTKRSLEFFLEERRSALTFIANEKSSEELGEQAGLTSIFRNLQDVLGNMVDLGFIDSSGKQLSYVGPYKLIGKDYSDQDWFHEVIIRGHYISDVFMGYRDFPHFVIAVSKKGKDGRSSVLRATVDSEILVEQLRSMRIQPPSEAFIINRKGVLQTPSINYGKLLDKASVGVPAYMDKWVVKEEINSKGESQMFAYAYIKSSPFILMVIKHPSTSMQNWFTLRRNLLLFLFFSMVVIVLLIMGMSFYMVSRIREADSQRAGVLHKVEYQNKMASLGRLAAGVAHEINNPLAIINEKAGMIKDLTTIGDAFPKKDKTLDLVDSILRSVNRCSRITRRLLGFAKHIDVEIETVELDQIIKEVISFLEHEARYRNIRIDFNDEQKIPPIQSDRGQLEQVFLNILNNSMNALSESENRDGLIRIFLKPENGERVSIVIEDNGPGISGENLKHIFEPFFTTRSNGTGLGLSITYGIVDKLGGQINVQSEIGAGTSLKVTMPLRHA